MSPHERGVDQAMRVLRGDTFTVAKLMQDYSLSRPQAKRDMAVLLWAVRHDVPRHGIPTVLGARLPA